MGSNSSTKFENFFDKNGDLEIYYDEDRKFLKSKNHKLYIDNISSNEYRLVKCNYSILPKKEDIDKPIPGINYPCPFCMYQFEINEKHLKCHRCKLLKFPG